MWTSALLRQLAQQDADAVACVGEQHTLSYRGLLARVAERSAVLRTHSAQVFGLLLDNAPLWVVLDLAALESQKVMIPLPFFFSAEQLAHSIRDAGITCILTDQAECYAPLLSTAGIGVGEVVAQEMAGAVWSELHLTDIAPRPLPVGTVKVTYTSGTTGHPKGVCLSGDTLLQVAQSLLVATRAAPQDQHLCVLPLATLLENLAGIYVPLLAGATCHVPSLATVGLSGSSGLEVGKLLATLLRTRATSTIFTPQLLHALVAAVDAGHPAPTALRFVALGGAPVAERLLRRAEALGIPVYEGYGLSECASVVALNTEAARCVGSVGKPLPHACVTFAADGEILVSGATLLGYTGEPPVLAGSAWHTGDIGHLDAQGFLHITGRKKNIFITAFGRNVSPEWVERELTLHPAIAQAAVFGEARPWNVVIVVPRSAEAVSAIAAAIADTNQLLPDYAQVKRWILATAPFSPQNGQMTPNGRLKRPAIWAQYQTAIEAIYD